MPGLFERFRRAVEAAEPGIVPTPADMDDDAPARAIQATDEQLIASLRRELAARDTTIGRLQEQLLARPTVPTSDRHCPNCAGLEKTIALLQDERGELRRRLTGYQLAETRGQRLRHTEPAP